MKNSLNAKNVLLNLDVAVASVAMLALVFCTFAGVIARYIVGKPFGWIEEVQAFMIIWVVFGAAGAAFRTANHAVIEIFYEMFPSIIKKILNIAILAVTVVTLCYLGYTCLQYIRVFAATGRTTAVLHFSYIMIYCIVPISCLWQVVNFILVNFFHYTEQETIESITDEEFENAEDLKK